MTNTTHTESLNMDRDTLLSLIDSYDSAALVVDVEGLIGEDQHTPEEVEAAVNELAEAVENMRRVIAWARLAPLYAVGRNKPAEVTA